MIFLAWRRGGGRCWLEGHRARQLYIKPPLGFNYDFVEYSEFEISPKAEKYLRGRKMVLTQAERDGCVQFVRQHFS